MLKNVVVHFPTVYFAISVRRTQHMAPKIISFTTLIEKDLEIICVDRIVNKLITTQIVKQTYDGIV